MRSYGKWPLEISTIGVHRPNEITSAISVKTIWTYLNSKPSEWLFKYWNQGTSHLSALYCASLSPSLSTCHECWHILIDWFGGFMVVSCQQRCSGVQRLHVVIVKRTDYPIKLLCERGQGVALQVQKRSSGIQGYFIYFKEWRVNILFMLWPLESFTAFWDLCIFQKQGRTLHRKRMLSGAPKFPAPVFNGLAHTSLLVKGEI